MGWPKSSLRFFFFFAICYRKNPNKLLGQPTMIHFHHCLLILHGCDPFSRLHLFLKLEYSCFLCFPHSSVGKASACNAGDLGLIPGLGRSPREGNGNPLQYSCLENPMDRGAWRDTVHGVARIGQDLVTRQQLYIRLCQCLIPV